MMAQIIGNYITTVFRCNIPPDVYFGNADEDELMVIQTVVIQWVSPTGKTFEKHIHWVWPAKDFT